MSRTARVTLAAVVALLALLASAGIATARDQGLDDHGHHPRDHDRCYGDDQGAGKTFASGLGNWGKYVQHRDYADANHDNNRDYC